MRAALLTLLVPALCLAQEAPRLTVTPQHFDFGLCSSDLKVSHRFDLSNSGGAPLKIGQLIPSCGCTTTLLGKALLAPGEHVPLEVSFNPKGLKGLVQRSLKLVSNDPVEPSQTLTFEAVVFQDFTVSTEELSFQDLTGKERRQGSVKLSSGTGQPITVQDVKMSPAPWLGVATRAVGDDVSVDFELAAERLPPGQTSGLDTITLELANPKPHTVELRVRWQLKPPVIVTPEKITWAHSAGKPLTTTVLLEHPEHKPFRILAARSSSTLLTVTGLPQAAAPRQTARVVFSGAAKPGIYNENVFLTLDTPGHPELTIKVTALLR